MLELDTIYNMDCMEGMKDIPDDSVDMVLCDMPYGTTENKWDVKLPLESLWVEYRRIVKKNAAIVLFSQMPFTAELVMSNRKMFRYEWIWEKSIATGFLNAKKMPLKCHENVLLFYDALPAYHPQMREGEPYTRPHNHSSSNYRPDLPGSTTVNADGKRFPRDVVKFNTPQPIFGKGTVFHPTQKPVALCE